MKITGRGMARILGCVCIIAACVIGFEGPWPVRQWGPGLLVLGLLLLGLAEMLGRVARLDSLLNSSAPSDMDRLRKMLGDVDQLRHVAGEATCAGCGKRAPRTDLCYNQALDAYYHRECLARDLGWSEQSQDPRNE